jgi:NAD+ diphosphatase
MTFDAYDVFAHVSERHEFVPKISAPQGARGRAIWLLYQGDLLVGAETGAASGAALAPLVAETVADLPLTPLRSEYLGFWSADGEVIDCYAGDVAANSALPAGLKAQDLRSLFGEWEERWIGLAGRAKLIAQWERDHQFCSRCGAVTERMPDERALRCVRCGLSSYPRISPAIIIAVTRMTAAGEELLLARNHRFPPGRYSVIAGFVEAGETLEECAAREVQEEVGLQIADIRYFGSQSWPFPNSLMIGLTAVYAGGEIDLEESEIADARWFSAHDMPQLPPKISIARRLIDTFLHRNESVVSD